MNMEQRLIDANALKDALNAWKNMDDYYHDSNCVDIPFTEAFDIIDNAPTIEDRQKGKWIIGETYDCHSDIIKTYTCPFCGVKEYSKYPFCHCGADMRGEENE